MNVLFLSPAFPAEMPAFVEGLAKVGAHVYGIGEQPEGALPERAKRALTAYKQVSGLFDTQSTVATVLDQLKKYGVTIDRVESPWEPTVELTAQLREALGVPGMGLEQATAFRDKEIMKQVLDGAGLRTPHHHRCNTTDQMRAAAEDVGFPLIVKPIAGAGSADTYRVNDAAELDNVIKLVGHVPEVSVEEFIEGEEFTFDTICANGEVLYYNIAWYRPRPLIARSLEWTSPQTMSLRDVDAPHLAPGKALGFNVLKALGFRDGYTHMEWFLTPRGEAVFGEIGARPPGARTVDVMNHACDADFHAGWASAVCYGTLGQSWERRYNAASIFKRAQGQGRIQRIEGLESLMHRYGRHIVAVELLPIGAPRRNWKQTLLSDGHLMVRHPDLSSCIEICDAVGTDLQLYAG
ncbi:MAG: hypothetical protein DHS20C15_23970 [Planctomycetota bacterium]|nr:MAG: hypothetical protein DHS20C15_23970 [Planctomycetota bacterium]